MLRKALWASGLRYRVASGHLPGRPDIVFPRERVAVFCDGDFWHGRELQARLSRLVKGHNASYWMRKIEGNVERDRRHTDRLERDGWRVLRFWETAILTDVDAAVERVRRMLDRR